MPAKRPSARTEAEGMNSNAAHSRRRYIVWLGGLASLASVIWFVRAVGQHLNGLATLGVHLDAWLWLAVAIGLYLSTYLIVVAAWRLAFTALESRAVYANLLRSQLLSQIGKYLPGNVGQYIGRAWLAKEDGLALNVVVASMMLELGAQLVGVGICMLPALELFVRLLRQHGNHVVLSFALAFLGLAAVVTSLLAWPPARRRVRDLAMTLTQLSPRRATAPLAGAVALYALSFTLNGTMLALLIHAAGGVVTMASLPTTVGIFGVAWLLGFLTPGAPAGLGIRDMTLVLGLTPVFGTHPAIAGALALRVATTLGDGIAFLLGLVLRARASSRKARSARSTGTKATATSRPESP